MPKAQHRWAKLKGWRQSWGVRLALASILSVPAIALNWGATALKSGETVSGSYLNPVALNNIDEGADNDPDNGNRTVPFTVGHTVEGEDGGVFDRTVQIKRTFPVIIRNDDGDLVTVGAAFPTDAEAKSITEGDRPASDEQKDQSCTLNNVADDLKGVPDRRKVEMVDARGTFALGRVPDEGEEELVPDGPIPNPLEDAVESELKERTTQKLDVENPVEDAAVGFSPQTGPLRFQVLRKADGEYPLNVWHFGPEDMMPDDLGTVGIIWKNTECVPLLRYFKDGVEVLVDGGELVLKGVGNGATIAFNLGQDGIDAAVEILSNPGAALAAGATLTIEAGEAGVKLLMKTPEGIEKVVTGTVSGIDDLVGGVGSVIPPVSVPNVPGLP